MFKKLLIVSVIICAIIVVLVIVAGVIVYLKVDKTYISSRMANTLSRQVYIGEIDISIFSVLSGIEIKNVSISNFKTPQELENLQGKPVAAGDIFTGMDSLRFKVKILPLLKRRVEFKELVLYSPVVNLSKNKQGVMNIDDLLKSQKAAGKENELPRGKEPDRPIFADDIPVAIAVGEIGMKNGTINYHDGEYDQKIQIYKLSALAHDISIDPTDLVKKNEIKVKLDMGIKTVGAMKTGSVQNFDVLLDVTGRVIPFDNKTRLLDPEVILHVAIPEGEITGLQLFNAIASIPLLGDYMGEHISFLQGKQQWKGASETSLDLRYKAAKVEITNGRLNLKDAGILFDGGMNTDTKALDMNLGIVMKKEINDSIKTALAQKIESGIRSAEVKKYADSVKLAEIAMKPLLNKDGQIGLKTKVGGTTSKPDVKLTQPQLGDLGNLVSSSAGSLAVEAGRGAVKQLLKEDQQKVLDGIEGLFKKK